MIDLEAKENWHARKTIEQDGGYKEDNYIDITWQHNAKHLIYTCEDMKEESRWNKQRGNWWIACPIFVSLQ